MMGAVIDAPVRSELAAVAEAMAAGLHTDPGWAGLVPDDEARAPALRTLLGHAVRTAFRDGTVLAARDQGRVVGGVVWAAPGDYPRPRRRDLAAAPRMLALGARTSGGTIRDLARAGQAIDRIFPAEPVWYVQALAVAPEAQGRGHGSALLAPVLAKSRATGVACYLETGKTANVGFYERLGFVLLDAAPLWAGGPTFWRMRRPADADAQPRGTT